MKIKSLCLFIMAFVPCITMAQTTTLEDKPSPPEFFKSGQLKSGADKRINCEDTQNINCLSIGDITIGGDFDKLKEQLGTPWHSLPKKDRSIDAVYPLRIYQYSTAYWVISHKDNRIIAVQLTGNRSPQALLFSGLQLGDKRDKVIATLGYPKARRAYGKNGGKNGGKNDAHLWDYSPLPFSLEIYNDRLYSVRVHMPDSKIPTHLVSKTMADLLTGRVKPKAVIKTGLPEIVAPLVNNKQPIEAVTTLTKNIQTKVTDTVGVIEQVVDKKDQAKTTLSNTKATLEHTAVQQTEMKTQITGQALAKIESAENPLQAANPLVRRFSKEQLLVVDTLTDWTDAWSQKDLMGYFSAYMPGYAPKSSASRSSWEEKRVRRINKPGWIKLKPRGFTFTKHTKNIVDVEFWLDYQTPNYGNSTLKALSLRRVGNRWLISHEESLEVKKR